MLFNHEPATVSHTFDDPNLVSVAGLVPVMRLAQQAGLIGLADERISLGTDKGAYPGAKPASLVAGMVFGAAIIAGGDLARARAPSLRRKLITIPARIARRTRKLILHLPAGWKWRTEFTRLYDTLAGRPPPATAGI